MPHDDATVLVDRLENAAKSSLEDRFAVVPLIFFKTTALLPPEAHLDPPFVDLESILEVITLRPYLNHGKPGVFIPELG